MPNDDLVYRDDLIRALNAGLDNMHDPDSIVARVVNAILVIVENIPAAKVKACPKCGAKLIRGTLNGE